MYLDAVQTLNALLNILNEAAEFQTGATLHRTLARCRDRIEISNSLQDVFYTLAIGCLQTLGKPVGQMAHPIVEPLFSC